jgi:5'-phosphate synthase pdxT subunit
VNAVAGRAPAARPVGILALQGDYAAHAAALTARGVGTRLVRTPAQLEGLAGLVLPGGETTTMLRLLASQGLEEPLAQVLRDGRVPIFATCAGLILLAREVRDPAQTSFGVLDVTVARNGYGRQIASGTFPIQGPGVPPGTAGVFIRAPRILRAGAGVEVLARRDADPVLVRQGHVLAACFHPELEDDHPVLRTFLEAVG